MSFLRWLGSLDWSLIFDAIVTAAAVGGLGIALHELRMRRRELADIRRKEEQRRFQSRVTATFERERHLAGFSNPKEKERIYLVLQNVSEAPAYVVDVAITALEEWPAPEMHVSETELPIKQIDAGGRYPIELDARTGQHSHRVEVNIFWKDWPPHLTEEDLIDRHVALPLRWV